MTDEWHIKEKELREVENLLIEIKGIIRENEKKQTLLSKIKLMILNSQKEKLKAQIKDLKQKTKEKKIIK